MECFDCEYFNKPKTNYERIKAMSVEEMAQFLSIVTDNGGICFNCQKGDICGEIGCIAGVKQWLESEVYG